jgi:hypothetical protein
MPKRSRNGEVNNPARVVAPIRVRSFADHDVELVVLHRGVEHLLDDGREPMDLVNEQHVARLQVGEQRRQIAGPLEHGARRLTHIHAELAREDVRERGLAQTGRTEDERMVERLAAHDRGLHEDLELRLDLLLPHVVREPLGANGAINRFFFDRTAGLHDSLWNRLVAGGHCGRTVPWRARRMRSSVEPPCPVKGLSICVTSAGL